MKKYSASWHVSYLHHDFNKNKKRRIRGFEGTLSNLVYKIRGFDI